MTGEKKNHKKPGIFFCGCCDDAFELLKGCFPDDAGYADCLARMNKMRDMSCGRRRADKKAEKINRGC